MGTKTRRTIHEQGAMHPRAFATFAVTDIIRRQAQLARELVDADPERQPA